MGHPDVPSPVDRNPLGVGFAGRKCAKQTAITRAQLTHGAVVEVCYPNIAVAIRYSDWLCTDIKRAEDSAVPRAVFSHLVNCRVSHPDAVAVESHTTSPCKTI